MSVTGRPQPRSPVRPPPDDRWDQVVSSTGAGAGGDNGIDHNKDWLRFPYLYIRRFCSLNLERLSRNNQCMFRQADVDHSGEIDAHELDLL